MLKHEMQHQRNVLSTPRVILLITVPLILICGIAIGIASHFDFSTIEKYIFITLDRLRSLIQTDPVLTEKVMTHAKFSLLVSSPAEVASEFLKHIPGYLITNVLMVVTLTVLLFRMMKRHLFPKNENLLLWQVPDIFIWVTIAALIPLIFVIPLWDTVASNILRILTFLYYMQGIAVFFCVFRRKKMKPIIQILIILLASLITIPLPTHSQALTEVNLNLPIVIGFFDVWSQFRKRLYAPSKRSTL